MRRGSGINKGTDPEQSAKRVEESTQPLTLLPHKTQSKLQGKHSTNPAFEGGQGSPERSGLFRGGQDGGALGKKLEKTRMRGGGAGGPGVSRGGPGEKRLKTRKNQKNAPELYG